MAFFQSDFKKLGEIKSESAVLFGDPELCNLFFKIHWCRSY